MSASVSFEPTTLSASELQLQADVRSFLQEEYPGGRLEHYFDDHGGHDRGFSRKLAERGWIGMALPKRYGGQERGAVERFIVAEELIRWGAPCGFHWVADRQSAQNIVRFGTEEQKQRFLPAISAGELSFSIGMSEPDAGSDLASVRTKATRVPGGWSITGTKVWTTSAHENDWFIALCRTAQEEDRHQGLTQFLIDLRSPGLEVHPIPFLDGTFHFNEVVLNEVFVPDDLVLGEVGHGWEQTGSELSYERSGPERWLSTYAVLESLLSSGPGLSQTGVEVVGSLVARYWGIRNLSLCVARMIDRGQAPAVHAALVKDMGTRFEQEVLLRIQQI
ncbi:MAG TPA: acyl-CoA dehydrogenase family protein, partial [Chloroflexota bacterium]|nr:acyl-CoA dehydrogenase family protein [Chloroflexota bacterium]